MGEGHCGLPVDELIAPGRRRCWRCRPTLIETALELELAEGAVVADTLEGAALRLPGRPLPRRAGHRRAPARPGRGQPPWPAIDAEQGHPLGGGQRPA